MFPSIAVDESADAYSRIKWTVLIIFIIILSLSLSLSFRL